MVDERCSTPSSPVRRRPASWRRCCRSRDQGYRGISGSCARRAWSRYARTRNGGSTACTPSRWPSSIDGWSATGRCGTPAWTRCPPRWPVGNANQGAEMTGEPPRILGRLSVADGRGIVRIEERFDTDVADLWSALTEPARLGRWLGEVDGDLRLGGRFRAHFFASGWEGN